MRTFGPQTNAARSVMRKNVQNPNCVRRTARILAIYATLKKLARTKKVPSIARKHWKRGNVVNQAFGRNARRLATNANC